MFRNRELRVKMVKTNDSQVASTDRSPKPYEDPETMNNIAKDFVRHTGVVVAGVLVTSFVLTAATKLLEKALEIND